MKEEDVMCSVAAGIAACEEGWLHWSGLPTGCRLFPLAMGGSRGGLACRPGPSWLGAYLEASL